MAKRRKKNNEFINVGEVIPRAIKHLAKFPEYKLYLIKHYWTDIVGKEIAAHTEPKNFSFGILDIGTANSVWANNLLYMKYDIIDKINNELKYKVIKDIRFSYGKMGSNKVLPVRMQEQKDIKRILANIKLNAVVQKQISDDVAIIKDEELSDKIKNIMLINKKMNELKKSKNWHECKSCGALCPSTEIYCSICERSVRHERQSQIRQLLMTKPWARYGEIKNYVPNCTKEMVNDARSSLVQKLAADLNFDNCDSIQIKMLVMLYKALPPEQINEKVVYENINRLKYDLKYDEMKKLNKKKGG